ncbi:MAG TPA: phosphatidylglycerol lysyltransferase domain-containing protein [Candidatus Limnocylindria bacterium]|nr:phosphatidylglycerol lysyltransferase domain-containing protein [Candidatus Limnocylindria bacterium]
MRRVIRSALLAAPSALIAAAGMVAALDAAALHIGLLEPVADLLPIEPDLSQPVTTGTAAIALIGLAVGLHRRKRFAWWLAVIVLLAALLVQIDLLRHVVGAVLAAVCLGTLIVVRRRFRVETGIHSRRLALLLCGIGAFLAVASVSASVGSALRIIGPATDARDVGSALISWLAFGDPGLAVPPHLRAGVLVGATLLARLAIAVGVIVALAPGEVPVRPRAELRAAEVAGLYGRGALLSFQLGPDASRFTVDGVDATLAYGRDRRVAVLLGDPIGPSREARRLLSAFIHACRRVDWIVAVYQASSAALTPLRAFGFHTYRIGQEALLDLASFDMNGSRRANLRHTVTRAKRGGVRVVWYPDGTGEETPALQAELGEIDRAWMHERGVPMSFSIGRFRAEDIAVNPVAVARDADGRAIAFTTFRSTGRDGGWVVDLIRRQPGGIPGAVEMCLVEAAMAFRSAGSASLSLGLAPLAGLSVRGGSTIERGLALAARAVRPAYDIAGLAFFKGKFAPQWEPRFLAVRRRRDLPAVLLALVRLHFGGTRGLLRAAWKLRFLRRARSAPPAAAASAGGGPHATQRPRRRLPRGASDLAAVGIALAAVLVAHLVGWTAATRDALEFMGFDPDRAVLITAGIGAMLGAAITALAGGRRWTWPTVGLLAVIGLFGRTFVAESERAFHGDPALGQLNSAGWLATVVAIGASALLLGLAFGVLAADARRGLVSASRALTRAIRWRRAVRPHRVRSVAVSAVVIGALLFTLPTIGQLLNYGVDSLMWSSGGSGVPLAGEGTAGMQLPLPGPPGVRGRGGAVVSRTVATTPPWRAWRPTGSGSVIERTLPAPWHGGSSNVARFWIYLPPGYATSRLRYPVTYEIPWAISLYDGGAQIQPTLNSLIDSGAIPPQIVVFLSSDGGPFVDNECIDAAGGREPFDSFIGSSLVPYIDATFRTIARPDARTVMGDSQGGFCAANVLLHHPALFDAAISFSGYYWASPLLRMGPSAQAPYGGSIALARSNSPMLTASGVPPAQRARTLFVLIGNPSQPFFGFQLDRWSSYARALGFDVRELVTPFGHSWNGVRAMMPAALEAVAQHEVTLGVFS